MPNDLETEELTWGTPNFSKDYHQLNAGANRRQATRVRAPALTWHRAFWLTPPYAAGQIPQEPDLADDRTEKKDLIDGITLAVWSHIFLQTQHPGSGFERPECHPRVRRPPQPGSQNESYVYLLFGTAVTAEEALDGIKFVKAGSLSPREQEIFESENRVVSLKCLWRGTTLTIRTELHTEYFILTVYVELPDRSDEITIKELKEKYEAIPGYFRNETQSESGASLSAFFFREFWRKFFLSDFVADQTLRGRLKDKIFHSIFADFRGLIICNDTYEVNLSKLGEGTELDWGTQIDKQCLQLFTHYDRYECTASYLLGGRAAYFTTLAPQIPEVSAGQIIPLEYILYTHQKYELPAVNGAPGLKGGVNRWQLGRLVDRIHRLGTMRLASLKYLPALRKAGATLSHLASYVNAAREAIDPENTTRTNVSADMTKVHSTFNKISSDFDLASETSTGILYRIEQSRYYKEQFDADVKALRIGRMEGYQRYDEFIERRLGSAFDFIDRLGRRYGRAMTNIETLDQTYLTMKIASIDTETNHIEDGIRKIQEWGEFALLAALVPYYVSHLLALIIEEKYLPVLVVMIWTIAFAFALYRKFNTKVYPLAIVGLMFAGVLAYLEAKYP